MGNNSKGGNRITRKEDLNSDKIIVKYSSNGGYGTTRIAIPSKILNARFGRMFENGN